MLFGTFVQKIFPNSMEKQEIKVVHVHLIFEKKDFYFGSLSAVFDTLEEERIGIKKSTLLHAGLTDGSIKMTQRARIVVSHLIRSNR